MIELLQKGVKAMLDDFWNVYMNHTFLYHFYECHLTRNKKIILLINGASVLATALALQLFTYESLRYLFVIMILLIQVFSSFKDVWDLTKKTWALRYCLRNTRKVLLVMANDWRLIEQGKLYEEDIVEKTFHYDSTLYEIIEEYLDDFDFAEIASFITKAL
jgi:hypothetical protein